MVILPPFGFTSCVITVCGFLCPALGCVCAAAVVSKRDCSGLGFFHAKIFLFPWELT